VHIGVCLAFGRVKEICLDLIAAMTINMRESEKCKSAPRCYTKAKPCSGQRETNPTASGGGAEHAVSSYRGDNCPWERWIDLLLHGCNNEERSCVVQDATRMWWDCCNAAEKVFTVSSASRRRICW